MISLNRIEKNYYLGNEVIHALNKIDLQVERGEFVAIVGPSGSGKSTLMNILGLLDVPDEGEYMLDGEEVGRLSEGQLACLRNQKIGFVFQSFNLLNTMNAFENVRLPLLYRGMKIKRANALVGELFTQLGMRGREKHLPSQLSGGQQQRIAIARALVGSPEIILADEPTGALDSKTSAEIMQVFDSLHKQGQTIILITHSPELARQAERVVTIVDGKLYEEVTEYHEVIAGIKGGSRSGVAK